MNNDNNNYTHKSTRDALELLIDFENFVRSGKAGDFDSFISSRQNEALAAQQANLEYSEFLGYGEIVQSTDKDFESGKVTLHTNMGELVIDKNRKLVRAIAKKGL